MKKGRFISFEGTDGVGKSTQIKLLRAWLNSKRKKVLLTHEPGGSRFAEKIRKLVLDPKNKISAITELLLYQAARADHVEHIIRPALTQGKWVLCDRFTDATIAYQGYGRGLRVEIIKYLNEIASQNCTPDLTIVLDLSPEKGLINTTKRPRKQDRMEKAGTPFQRRVRYGYKEINRLDPKRVKRITVREKKSDTQNLIREYVKKQFEL